MPYTITTKTPPNTGAMACCRSTIGAGRCHHMLEQSRRAAATLEEARGVAREACKDNGGPIGRTWDAMTQAEHLPEAGGTIGPLHDGTVIEVSIEEEKCD